MDEKILDIERLKLLADEAAHGAENITLKEAESITRVLDYIDHLEAALREIADHPTIQRNPDGVDQAAATMQLIAREALKEGKEK